MWVHAVAITDQDTRPVVDQCGKGFFESMGMHHVEHHGVTNHHPEPLQLVREKPRRFINVGDSRLAYVRRDGPVVCGSIASTMRSKTFWIALS